MWNTKKLASIGIVLSVVLAGFSSIARAESKQSQDAKITHYVDVETSLGVISLGLYGEAAPKTVENFIQYTNDGFYNGTVFHRVIDNFMIQGGGFDTMYQQKPTRDTIKNEAANGLKNKVGTIAMARTGVVDSATSQFFINVSDNPFLDHRNQTRAGFGYAVFGRVTQGMDVVNQIKVVPKKRRGHHVDAPAEHIEILSAKLRSPQ